MTKRRTKAAPAPGAETHPGFAPSPESLQTQVVLIRDHRHAGRDYREGATFMATPAQVDTLRKFGAIA